MKEIVSYEGETGLVAILQAMIDLRQNLQASEITSEQAAGYLGCINLHLGQVIGVSGELMAQLQECAGLLCPECKGYVGFVSDLSGCCYHCGERLFPGEGDGSTAAEGGQAHGRSMHLAHQGVQVHKEP
jgi:hypothetical protein